MIGILLMSHGKMAEGMLDSCQLFFGEAIQQLQALCLAKKAWKALTNGFGLR